MSADVARLLGGPASGDPDSRATWFAQVEASLDSAPQAWLAECGTAMSQDQGWVLLSWAEDAASRTVSEQRASLVELAAFAMSLLEASPLDRRDVMVVALLLHRGSDLAGHDFDALVRRGCARAGELGARCEQWLLLIRAVTPSTHEETGVGRSFAFRRRDSDIDVDALARKFSRPDS